MAGKDTAFSRIRVEAAPASTTEETRVDHEMVTERRKDVSQPRTLDDWRRMAVQTSERLAIAENQAKDLRTAADEMRARVTKQKTRLDNANARINDLQSQLVTASAKNDEMQERIGRLDEARKAVHAFRRECLEGSLWKVFENL